MKQRVILRVNGNVLYDSGLPRDDIEVETIVDRDVVDPVYRHAQATVESMMMQVNVTDPKQTQQLRVSTIRKPQTEAEWDEWQQLQKRTI